MKRMTLVGLLIGGLAMAATLTVPFYFDNATTNQFPPATGETMGFIGVANTTSSAVVMTLTYTTPQGVDVTPGANTYSIPANQSVSWEPAQNNPNAEGVGANVPNATSGVTGVCIIEFAGSDGDLVGRFIQWSNSAVTAAAGWNVL